MWKSRYDYELEAATVKASVNIIIECHFLDGWCSFFVGLKSRALTVVIAGDEVLSEPNGAISIVSSWPAAGRRIVAQELGIVCGLITFGNGAAVPAFKYQ